MPRRTISSPASPSTEQGALRGISDLHLVPGQTVLDAGCRTRLNFAHLEAVLGPSGHIIGLDRSPAMLDQARRRIRRHGWENIDLVRADLTAASPDQLRDLVHRAVPAVDAVLATYSLSVTRDPEAAWRGLLGICQPGTQVSIVDM